MNKSAPMEMRTYLGNPFLGMVTFFQHMEKLSDHQAVEAISARIDWKYALHLPINSPLMNPFSLCIFRQKLLSQSAYQMEFQRLLDRLIEGGFIEKQEPPLEALRVLAEVCMRTRLDQVMTGMCHTLEALALRDPEWLRQISLPHWYRRYDVANRQTDLTQSMEQQRELADAIGADITFLLEAITQENKSELCSLNEVQELYRLWREQIDPIRQAGITLLRYCHYCGVTP